MGTRKRERVWVEKYGMVYERRPHAGGGYSFPCSKTGVINLKECNLESLEECLLDAGLPEGERQFHDPVFQDYSYAYYEPAVIECCGCDSEVVLYDAMTNTCPNPKCGMEYNGGGQLLAPRSQWGLY